MLVHGVLKRGVFKPVYSHYPKFVAMLTTFIASGLMHEYILVAVFTREDKLPSLGIQTLFFIWNAGVIAIETLIGKAYVFTWIKNNLHRYVVAFLVLSTAMPIAHWFLHPFSKTSFFTESQIAFVMLVSR